MAQQTNPIAVAIYARVSSERQDVALSISGQLKALREFAQNNGYIVVREYVDEAKSGRSTDRPQFIAMIADAKAAEQPFEAILVWKFSRFTRNREDSILFKATLKRRGIKVISISEPAEDSPTGDLMEAIIEGLDEYYSKNLAQDVMRGMREASSRGFWITARAPIGYQRKLVNDSGKQRPTLVLDPPADALVKRMFDMAALGDSLLAIVKALNHEGFTTARGYPWRATAVHHILTNEAYTGTLIWGVNAKDGRPPIRVEDAFPAIVSREQFDRVRQQLRSKAPGVMHPRRAASLHLLSGLVKCHTCGLALVAAGAKSGQYTYYICSAIRKGGPEACDGPRLNSKKFEQRVIAEIRDHVLTESNIHDLMLLMAEEMEEVESEARLKLDVVAKELADVSSAVERLWHALETSDFDASEVLPRIRAHQSRQQSLDRTASDARAVVEERRALLANAETIGVYASKLGGLIESSGVATARSFLRSFVKEIVVTADAFTIRYTLPTEPESSVGEDDEEDDEGSPDPVRPIVPLGLPTSYRTHHSLVEGHLGCVRALYGAVLGHRYRVVDDGRAGLDRDLLHEGPHESPGLGQARWFAGSRSCRWRSWRSCRHCRGVHGARPALPALPRRRGRVVPDARGAP